MPPAQSSPYLYPILKYWPQTSEWLIMHRAQPQRIIKLAVGGNIQTLVNLEQPATSFVRATHGGRDYVFYCSETSGRLRRADITVPGSVEEDELPWPIENWKCTGKNLVYDSAQQRIIFQVQQFGLHGVAEHRAPFP